MQKTKIRLFTRNTSHTPITEPLGWDSLNNQLLLYGDILSVNDFKITIKYL